MKFKLVSTLALISFVLFALFFPQPSKALTPQELEHRIEQTKRDRDALVAEQKRLQAELNAVSQQGQSLATAVKGLDATKKKLSNDIKITQSRIASTDLNIQMLEDSVDEKARQISTHRKAIASVLKELSKYDTRSLVLDVLSHDQISDVWGERARLETLNGQLGTEISGLRQTREVLDREKVLKEKTKEELQSLQSQLGGQKKIVEDSQSAKARLLAETKNKEAEYQRMLKENIARQKQFEDELYKFESQMNVTIDPNLIPASRPGVLAWPLDYVFVTQRFGKTSGSSRLYASGTHNGIDFRAAQGTPVKAMLEGTVVGAGNTDDQKGCYSYGRWLLIKHANGTTAIYAHLSGALVKQGQTVSTGQVIGYSGGTPRTNGAGYSTGPHLHIGLFASQGVSVQQFTSSNNCKQVFVPVADAQAYLDPLAYLPSAN